MSARQAIIDLEDYVFTYDPSNREFDDAPFLLDCNEEMIFPEAELIKEEIKKVVRNNIEQKILEEDINNTIKNTLPYSQAWKINGQSYCIPLNRMSTVLININWEKSRFDSKLQAMLKSANQYIQQEQVIEGTYLLMQTKYLLESIITHLEKDNKNQKKPRLILQKRKQLDQIIKDLMFVERKYASQVQIVPYLQTKLIEDYQKNADQIETMEKLLNE